MSGFLNKASSEKQIVPKITTSNEVRVKYFDRYKDLCIAEAERSQVPASILMAQAILEGESGESDVAKTANNHFGMHCARKHKHDAGYCVPCDTDQHCIAFGSPEESWVAHTDLLMTTYASLLGNDYLGWAAGLEGWYATDENYEEALIELIEGNNLTSLDNAVVYVPTWKKRLAKWSFVFGLVCLLLGFLASPSLSDPLLEQRKTLFARKSHWVETVFSILGAVLLYALSLITALVRMGEQSTASNSVVKKAQVPPAKQKVQKKAKGRYMPGAKS
ncbi:MAG: glucosaminidase domain-containing protein [Candidatus Peribacteria bacterium]|nr:MAG: glucosaminidase domain-containing protein [Candidatus Peribacteria bacterium]